MHSPENVDPCCGNSEWNGLLMGFHFTIGISVDMPMGFDFISFKLNLRFYTGMKI